MNAVLALALAAAAFGTATVARELARDAREEGAPAEAPFAPSRGAAPFVSLGYRELAADLLFVRFTGYFATREATADSVAELVEAIVTLDPRFQRIYDWGPQAMTIAQGVDNAILLRALAVLERGMREFPDGYKAPLAAGEIYMLDLKTDDPAQRRAWDEEGTRLFEAAIRKPGAPTGTVTYVAEMRTRLGQHQRAVDGLREMLLTTTDPAAQQRIIEKLAALEQTSAAALAGEMQLARRRFEQAWAAERPMVTPTWYVLLGKPLPRTFDMTDLATGGRDLIGSQLEPPLEPLE